MKKLIFFISIDNIISRYVILASLCATLSWIIFKIAYPYPDFFSDSYSYMDAALSNRNINIWPIGYSKFIYLFHKIIHSDTGLVTFQYIMLEIGCIYFFITILYFFKISGIYRILVFSFLFCNPFILYVSNYISSDALFCSISLFWATEIIWIIYSPNDYQFITPTLCMFITFTMRYNAMYYPIINLIAFLLSKNKGWVKILGSFSIIPMLFAFFIYSRQAGQELIGHPLSSILSGWQLGNNALYMRGHISVDTNKLPSDDCRNLDRISRNFFKIHNKYIDEALQTNMGCYFIQSQEAPLKQYMYTYAPPGNIKSWASVAPVFTIYGEYLIKTNPIAYFRYFLWPNTRNYFYPFLEKLTIYNRGSQDVGPLAVYWFHYHDSRIHCINPTLQGSIMSYYPPYFFTLNLILIGLVSTKITHIKSKEAMKKEKYIVLIFIIFWFTNFTFSVLANIIVLRYQLFPMIVFTAGCLCLINSVVNKKTIQLF
jgi:hypothetical protein